MSCFSAVKRQFAERCDHPDRRQALRPLCGVNDVEVDEEVVEAEGEEEEEGESGKREVQKMNSPGRK